MEGLLNSTLRVRSGFPIIAVCMYGEVGHDMRWDSNTEMSSAIRKGKSLILSYLTGAWRRYQINR